VEDLPDAVDRVPLSASQRARPSGHLDVEEHEREVVLEQQAQCLVARARPDQLAVGVAQELLERDEALHLIVDNEDARHHRAVIAETRERDALRLATSLAEGRP